MKILKKQSEYLQDQRAFVGRIKRATMYPSFVLGFAFLVMIGMFVFVVPTFQKVILKLHGELPVLTQFLFGVSGLMRNVYFVGFWLVAFIVGFILFRYLRKIDALDYAIDSWKLRAPVIKSILYPLSIGRFARSLSLLISSGLPLLRAIEVAKTTVVNRKIEHAIDDIRRQVIDGGTLYEAFKSTKTFPIMMVEMIGIGESSGKLQQLLEKVAQHLEEEADYNLNKFLTYIEPILIILVGGLVLMVILGIYLPVFSLQTVLRTL